MVASPCIIFFEEFDLITVQRKFPSDSWGTFYWVINRILTEINGVDLLWVFCLLEGPNWSMIINFANKSGNQVR